MHFGAREIGPEFIQGFRPQRHMPGVRQGNWTVFDRGGYGRDYNCGGGFDLGRMLGFGRHERTERSNGDSFFDIAGKVILGLVAGSFLGKLFNKGHKHRVEHNRDCDCNNERQLPRLNPNDNTPTGKFASWSQEAMRNSNIEPFNVFKETGFRNEYNNAVKSGDAKAIKSEYKKGMEAFVNDLFDNKYDTNHNGLINKAEFIKRELYDNGIDPRDKEALKVTERTFDLIAGKDNKGNQNKYIDKQHLTAAYAYLDCADGSQDSHIKADATNMFMSDNPKTIDAVRDGLAKRYAELYS